MCTSVGSVSRRTLYVGETARSAPCHGAIGVVMPTVGERLYLAGEGDPPPGIVEFYPTHDYLYLMRDEGNPTNPCWRVILNIHPLYQGPLLKGLMKVAVERGFNATDR